MNDLDREISQIVKKSARDYPVITVVGPRQSGKTTLVKTLFPKKPYYSMEIPSIRKRVTEDPEGFLLSIPNGAILDEVQRTPEILSYIQTIVDEKNKSGMFILTGSSNLLLMQSVTQSLAGRTAIFKLLPLSIKEINKKTNRIDELILKGGYPRLITKKPERNFFFQNYIETYVERDVRLLLKIKDEMQFLKFLQLCAGRIGSIIDYTSLGNDTGISTKTVKEWISILEASYICFLLPPWYENRNKRLIKAPKLYFYDTGLASSLLHISTEVQMSHDPLRGSLFENLVILEKIKQNYNQGINPEFYFYRDSNGVEVDLIENKEGKLFPTEIKSAATFNNEFAKGIIAFSHEYNDKVAQGTIVYTGKDQFKFKDINVTPFIINQ